MIEVLSQTTHRSHANASSEIILSSVSLLTPLGPVLAVASSTALYMLEFVRRPRLESDIDRLKKKMKVTVIEGWNPILRSIEEELSTYFEGGLTHFKTPIAFLGTPFQHRVWEELQKIPYGATCSYRDIAIAMGAPASYRAVAQANRSNVLAIIVPCHRVISASGALSGYAGGIDRKAWLLQQEES